MVTVSLLCHWTIAVHAVEVVEPKHMIISNEEKLFNKQQRTCTVGRPVSCACSRFEIIWLPPRNALGGRGGGADATGGGTT